MINDFFYLDHVAVNSFELFHQAIDNLRNMSDGEEKNLTKQNLLGAFMVLQENMYCLECKIVGYEQKINRNHQNKVALLAKNNIDKEELSWPK